MLDGIKHIYFVGIKGVAMANLAVFFKKAGKKVSGSDIEEEFITDRLLKKNKIKWSKDFNIKNLPKDIDLIVYSSANKGLQNSQIIESNKRGLKLISQAELLGLIMKEFSLRIAVSGCHGKTTTSSLLSYALNKLKAFPSYIVGVPFFTDYHIICTNIDFDHPDVYKNLNETKQAFLKFFDNKKLFLDIDNKNIKDIYTELDKKNITTYGFSENAEFRIINSKIDNEGSLFEVSGIGKFRILLYGKMNISNATSVIVVLNKLGYKSNDIQNAISQFKGAERRFELKYQESDTYLFDDYAHHPTEIEATIEAARERFKDRRILVIFQPHTFSRTKSLLKEFSEALSKADYTFLLPIFSSSRENRGDFKITTEDIINNSSKKNLLRFHNVFELLSKLQKIMRKGDIIFTMGAGNVYKLKDEIARIIKHGKWNIKEEVDLYHYLTLRTHVIAEYFIDAKTREDIICAKKFSIEKKLPIFLFGGGSNVAITRKKILGLVIKNSYIKKTVVNETEDFVDLSVSSGYPVSLLINKTIDHGLSGFEYHKGLPGTVGGAIAMNSKWTRPISYFSDSLLYAYLVDNKGHVKKVSRKYFKFTYDYSTLKDTREFVLEAVFRLKRYNPYILKKRAEEALHYRKLTQPHGISSSGCFFKNITVEEKLKLNLPTTSAGYLIDKSGLKGHAVGDFYVSKLHANFIINKGKGKRKDLLKMITDIKAKVKQRFGIELEEEVVVV
ncbi:MAG: UDP-N-acetylmuramate-L-alanine ligase [Candidatus Roizmanbacteria bacterium GW2011_GWA2_35_8]|uniref:UDP-N-acetylenolpyruvoylglucosamine reductase n=1 Tax=Candidatus Roizmanbacteria bacterium GW2011_GWA2_35_8 TaxID=1618479 RepID=A0A0G0DF77_9BACT|nr:MAG: UDP-N-acetylmuramate-L-alanine ligase [Candidatus Roizmanbacteria bacterium GW2011_GWA2_35_8]